MTLRENVTGTYTVEQIEKIGWDDGAEAAIESGSDEPPVDGWDGWTIKEIGLHAFFDLFGLGERYAESTDEGRSWQHDDVLYAAAAAYARGAQRGATEALEEA